MRIFSSILIVVGLMLGWQVKAQISPGKLSNAHKQLEGLGNCTQCHNLGESVSDAKCLACHKSLNDRIVAKKGFHVSKEVKGKSCIECHSEHHGVNFDMIHLNKKTFNHLNTGYELKGAHKVIDCAKCHKNEFIVQTGPKKMSKTYLGLDTKCSSCHQDVHQQTLGNDCAKCHNEDSFKPANKFNHQTTDFPLVGAHKKVDCTQCHKPDARQNSGIVKFNNVAHQNCTSCHTDHHKGQFGTNCKGCHTEESFTILRREIQFNHQVTSFKLEGKHQQLDCAKCHDGGQKMGKFQEFRGRTDFACIQCHKDVHEGKFGTDCATCHNTQSFRNAKTEGFDHNKTAFALQGKHQTVDCAKCHKGKMTDPVAHNQCRSCHSDFHNNQFFASPKYTDCNNCHTVAGFSPSTFELDQHNANDSPYALRGAHLATPCIDCHKKDNNQWNFRFAVKDCKSCHDDKHQGFMAEKFYEPNGCESCHQTESWAKISFDHAKTNFELSGKHQTIDCRSCHFEGEGKNIIQRFTNLNKDCVSCHDNVHEKQFEVDGQTDCVRCHGFESWKASNFNHDNTRFKLEGAHVKLDCEKCHKNEIVNGQTKTLYKINKLECIDCHQ